MKLLHLYEMLYKALYLIKLIPNKYSPYKDTNELAFIVVVLEAIQNTHGGVLSFLKSVNIPDFENSLHD